MDFKVKFRILITPHKVETEHYQRKLNAYNFLIFFVSFNNLDAFMKVKKKTRNI